MGTSIYTHVYIKYVYNIRQSLILLYKIKKSALFDAKNKLDMFFYIYLTCPIGRNTGYIGDCTVGIFTHDVFS